MNIKKQNLGLVGLLNNMVVLPPPPLSDILVIGGVVPNAPILSTRHQRPRRGAFTIPRLGKNMGPPYQLARPHVVCFFLSFLTKKRKRLL